MSQFPLARILDFISQVIPFDHLDEEELQRVVGKMEIAYYPRGAVIIEAGGPSADQLFIIHGGSVKITVISPAEEELLVDVRGEGDIFGAVSLLSSRQALFTVTAQEDLLVFLLPASDFRGLVRDHPVFQRHFQYSLARNIQAVFKGGSSPVSAGSEGVGPFKQMAVQMRSRVADLMGVRVLTCRPDASIRQATQAMTVRGVGSIVVVGDDGRPLGLVTDTDLRTRVLAAGVDSDQRVDRIMSQPPLTISVQAFAFEAMLEMTRHGVHHLVATEGERMVGVISDHDIKVIIGGSPVGLVREIENIGSLEELARIPSRLTRVLEMLVGLNSSSEYMMSLLSEFVDRLIIKIGDFSENKMVEEGLGPWPASYCWLSLGRAGREEQAPPLYQNFALVYSDVPREREGVVREWFLGFSRRVAERLAQLGLEPRPFQLIKNGAVHCRSASEWRTTFANWIRGQVPGHWEEKGAALDFRPVLGESAFIVSLRNAIFETLDQYPAFLREMAEAAGAFRPPLGFLRKSVVERDGQYSEHWDLNMQGLRPIIAAVRVLALEHKTSATNTMERLADAARKMFLDKRLEDDLREAFSFMTLLRISRYLQARNSEVEFSDLVAPSELNTLQRKMLKDSFAVIDEFQTGLRRRPAVAGAGA
ncbi:MAG: putative nucleotidyltransferase substrate binding domain-containing protein [Pseudomonadota bacterium]